MVIEGQREVLGNRDAREVRHKASESQKRQGTTEARRRRGEDYLDRVERPTNILSPGGVGPLELLLHGRTIPAVWRTNEQVTVMYTAQTCAHVQECVQTCVQTHVQTCAKTISTGMCADMCIHHLCRHVYRQVYRHMCRPVCEHM